MNPVTVPFEKTADTKFKTVNPFGDSFTLLTMSGRILKGTSELATMNVTLDGHDKKHQPVVVPAQSTITTPQFGVKMINPLSIKAIGALGKGLVHDLKVSVFTQISAKLGNYSMNVSYNDSSLPAVIDLTLK